MTTDITLTGGAGEYMESATLVEWRARPGERVEAGALLAVVETAKAATEIEAPASGILLGPLAEIGTEIAVGTVLGRIGDGTEATATPAAEPEGARPAAAAASRPAASPAGDRLAASPLAKRLARQRGIDLASVRGSGPGGRIKSRDLPGAVRAAPVEAFPIEPGAPFPGPAPTASGDPRPLVVLLHGFGANRSSWAGLVPRLGAAVRVVALDLPGHGRNASAAADLDAIAGEVADRLEREPAEAVHLVGHSLGGAVAARLGAMNRLPLASLTLLAPAGLGPDIDGAFLSGFLRARTADSLSPWLERLVAAPAVLPAGFAAAVLREREEAGLAERQERLAGRLFPDGTQAIDVRADLLRPAVPVKVLWGLADAIIPPAHALRLPGTVALHRFEGVGHMPALEAPDLVARLVLENVRAGAVALGPAV